MNEKFLFDSITVSALCIVTVEYSLSGRLRPYFVISSHISKNLRFGLPVVTGSANICAAGNIYFVTTPRNSTVAEGNRARLQCRAEGYPENITYRWYRNGVDVQLIPGLMQVRRRAFAVAYKINRMLYEFFVWSW